MSVVTIRLSLMSELLQHLLQLLLLLLLSIFIHLACITGSFKQESLEVAGKGFARQISFLSLTQKLQSTEGQIQQKSTNVFAAHLDTWVQNTGYVL